MEATVSSFSKLRMENDGDSKVVVGSNSKAPFSNNEFNSLFNEYRETIINSLITAFGLDAIIFKDIEGGNVQTINNAEQGVYADDVFESRGERDYNRNDYATSNYMNKRRKADFQNNDKIIDGYTGIELSKDGSSHLEHVVSAKEVHDHTGIRVLMSKQEMSEILNDKSNTIYTDSSLNMSKNDSDLSGWSSKPNSHDKEMTNGEYYRLNDKKAKSVDQSARTFIDNEFAKKKLEHYASSMKKDALNQGSAMAIRQSLGVVLTQIAIVITDRLPMLIEEMKNNFSLENFIDGVIEIIKESFEKIKAKSRQIFDAATSGFASGLFASFLTTIINMFFTTARHIVKIIRQTMVSITEAVRILFFDNSGRSSGQKLLAASKVILTGLSVVVGVIIDQGVHAFLMQTGVSVIPIVGPVISDVVSTFCGVLVTGIMSVTILYFLEHSEIVKRLIEFIDKLNNDCFDKAIIKMTEANKLLDQFIAKLCEIDITVLKEKIKALHNVSLAIDEGNTEALYNYCRTNQIDLPFSDNNSFVAFIENKNEIFEI